MEKNLITSSWTKFSNSLMAAHEGESSHCICEICADKKDIDQMFAVPNCRKFHRYCTKCITKYIETKLQKRPAQNQGNTRFLKCPGLDCKGFLTLPTCRRILPQRVITMWEDELCESTIVPSQKLYCPFKDCSAMIVNDSKWVIREAECPFCHRLFCAHCEVPWHSGSECKDFTKLDASEIGREDRMLHELAKTKQWQRCPRCKFFVEKTQGCLQMTCRCKHGFCYACGETWSSSHGLTCKGRAPRLT